MVRQIAEMQALLARGALDHACMQGQQSKATETISLAHEMRTAGRARTRRDVQLAFTVSNEHRRMGQDLG